MHHDKEKLTILLVNKGWSQPLVDATFVLVGGFDNLAKHANFVWPMMFTNNLVNQIELDEDGGDLLAATQIFSSIRELSNKNMTALKAYFDTYSDDILRALKTQFDEPAKRIVLVSENMSPEDSEVYINEGQLKEEYIREVVNGMVYYACYWLTDINGGFNTERLSLIDLSGVNSISLFNGQVHVESKPKEKYARFIGTLEELYEICSSYYIKMFWGGMGKGRGITGLHITKKESLAENIPIFISLKKLSSIVTRGSCFVELHMKSASKSINESDLICLTEDTVAKIKVEGCHYLELIMSENAALDLSRNVVSGNGSIEDQSRLIATDFKPDSDFSCNRLDDNSRVFSNSENFYVERQIGEDESIFASKVAERLDEGYMTYLRHKRMED
jgi:hypothetical protein